jgi:hypothetical protein
MSASKGPRSPWSGGSTAALLAGLVLAAGICGAWAQARAAPGSGGVTRMAFLSPDRSDPETGTRFDGRWIFTSAGCPYTGSLRATIRRGRILVKGGSGTVSPDGTLHSVGAGGGMTLTSVGTLTGGTGAGTFNRSDGCAGSWIAIKR